MAISPACCDAPVDKETDPEMPVCDAPVPNTMAPLEPSEPALAVSIRTLPLEDVVPWPDMRITEPPVDVVLVPAVKAIEPPRFCDIPT